MTTRSLRLILLGAALQTGIAAAQPPFEVGDAVMRIQEGERSKEETVLVRFEADAIVIHSQGSEEHTTVKRLPYTDITSADYSIPGDDLPGLRVANRGPQRRLTIRSGDEVTILRLHKSDQKRIRRELTKRSGIRVQKAPYLSHGSFHWPAAI